MIRICHMSDLHGNLDDFFAGTEFPDMWIVTGDFFPNNEHRAVGQEPYQEAWIRGRIERFIDRLGGKPLVWVAGNHDYICLVEEIHRIRPDYPAYVVAPDGVEVLGIRFAGFRHINYIKGEWAGEMHPENIEPIVEQTFTVGQPQILVTHAPPGGILCDAGTFLYEYGIRCLATWLIYRPHNVVAHFFGHAHFGQGDVEEMGIRFYNGSNHVRFHDIDI